MDKKFTVSDTEKQLQECLSYALAHMGLEKFKVQIGMDHTSMGQVFNVHFYMPVEIGYVRLHQTEHQGVIQAIKEDVIDPWVSALQNSPAVQEVKQELADKIIKLELQATELRTEVARLKPFENHFDVEMKLRHGEKS